MGVLQLSAPTLRVSVRFSLLGAARFNRNGGVVEWVEVNGSSLA